jgi:hypothetical protein
MVEQEFIDEQSERLFKYFQAKNLLLGILNYPSVDKIKVIVRELCEIAEVEGNARDAFIQVFINQNGNLVVRPVVKIQRKKSEEDED